MTAFGTAAKSLGFSKWTQSLRWRGISGVNCGASPDMIRLSRRIAAFPKLVENDCRRLRIGKCMTFPAQIVKLPRTMDSILSSQFEDIQVIRDLRNSKRIDRMQGNFENVASFAWNPSSSHSVHNCDVIKAYPSHSVSLADSNSQMLCFKKEHGNHLDGLKKTKVTSSS